MDKQLKLDMGANNFKVWNIENLKNRDLLDIYVDKIIFDSSLIVKLISNKFKIKLNFKRFISYRITSESYLLDYWEILNEKEQNGNVFYLIENSSFFNDIQNLSKDFFVIGGADLIYHFAVFSNDYCIEIISDLYPEIEIVDNE